MRLQGHDNVIFNLNCASHTNSLHVLENGKNLSGKNMSGSRGEKTKEQD